MLYRRPDMLSACYCLYPHLSIASFIHSPIYPYIHKSISMSPPYADYAGYILCTFFLSTRYKRGFYVVARRLRAGFLSVPQGILSAILPAIITASPQVIRLAGYRLLRLRMQAGS